MYCLHQTDNSFRWKPGPALALTNQYELSLSLMKLQMILAVLNAIYATALRSLKNSRNPMLPGWRSSRVRGKSIMNSNCWFKYLKKKEDEIYVSGTWIWFHQTSWWRLNYHRERLRKLTFRGLALCHSLWRRANARKDRFLNLSWW